MSSEPGAQERLFGRDLQLATLSATLADVRTGKRGVVLVEGDSGMGKTSLVRAAFADERCTLLWASGDEHEAEVDHGVIDQLVRQAPLDAAAADELRSTASRADPLQTGAGVVRLIDGLFINPLTPLVVVVDDAQWADTASLRALTFAARRLTRDPVLLCVVARTGATNLPSGLIRLADASGVRMRLSPLDRGAVQQVASVELGTEISRQSAGRLLEHCGGNPLHLRALLEELTPAMITSGLDLPAPRSFSTLVLSRLGGAPAHTEELVAAVAVVGDAVDLSMAAQIAQVASPLPALDHAVTNGLLVVVTSGSNEGPMQVAMPHPLVRAAVLDDLPPGRRADLHRRAGALLEDPAGLRHRLLGAISPDAALWAEAVEAARREVLRGAHGTAASLYRAAGSVAPSSEARERSLLDTIDQLLLAGRQGDAVALRPALDTAQPSARKSYVAGRLAYVVGPRRDSERLLRDAWSRLSGADRDDTAATSPEERELAARIAAMLATVSVDRAIGAAAIEWCERTLALSPEQAALASTAHMLASAYALTGDMDGGLGRLDAWCAERLGDAAASGVELADLRSARGLLRLWTHDLEGAVEDLSASLEAAGTFGSFVARETSRSFLAEARYRQGSWDEALLLGQVATSVVDDSGHDWMAVLPHASMARPLAARGEVAAAEHLRAAQSAAEKIGVGVMVGLARITGVDVASCARDHQTVVALGEKLVAAAGGADERIAPWRANVVESLVATDSLDLARRLTHELCDVAQHTALTRSEAARAAVALAAAEGDDAALDDAAEAGLSLDAAAVGPYPRARLELVVGRAWRRRGARRKAAAVLEAARGRFEALAARPWLSQVEQELTASGLKPARRSNATRTQLTPQEQAIARLVAQGLTNREVGAELVVSAKTVEHHLSRIYAKLGVRSRTELAALLAR